MSRLLLLSAFFLVFLAACKFNPNLQGRGSDIVQGVWAEDSVAYRNELMQYTTHQFKFTCDSFYVTLNTFAKANIYPDSCFNNGQWTEYAKGNYAVRNDSLFIAGTFTKSNFKQKISGCYRIGLYLETFIIKNASAGSLKLQSTIDHRPTYLTLKNKTTCIPQTIN